MKKDKQKIGRALKLSAVPLALATLAACATPFNADVSRYAVQLPAPQGESFYVVPEDPALANSLEFSRYADYVEAELRQLGYAEAARPEDATLLVEFDYGVGQGREKIRSTGGFHDPFYTPWYTYQPVVYNTRHGARVAYVPARAWGYGWHDPFFNRPHIDSYTVYPSGIELKINRAVDGYRLFEGRAEAVSTTDRLQYLVPNLVDAMFVDFPGNSGETVRISIAPEEQQVKRRR